MQYEVIIQCWVMVFVMFLALFVAMQVYYYGELQNARDAQAAVGAKRVARELGQKINLVARTPGASTDFFVPQALEMGGSFVLWVSNSSVEIDWEGGRSAVEPVQAAFAVNSTGSQPFALAPGYYWINHSSGGAVLSAK